MSSPFTNPVIVASPVVGYNGTDITATIMASLNSLKYTDTIDSKSDSVEINLEDPDGRFRKVQVFQGGNPITLSIKATIGGQTLTGNYGSFEIDRIKVKRDVKAGARVSIKANSCPVSKSARLAGKSQGYSATTLSQLTSQIAARNGMTPKYTATDFPITRSDQVNESDFVLLKRNCDANGLDYKVQNGQIYVFDRIALEAAPVVATITEPGGLNGVGGLLDWDYDYNLEDVYAASQISAMNAATGRNHVGTFQDPDAPPTDKVHTKTFQPNQNYLD
jgi:phage protein D